MIGIDMGAEHISRILATVLSCFLAKAVKSSGFYSSLVRTASR